MSSPIRVGILGLGKGSQSGVPGLWAAQAHLPYLLASPRYHVVAVSNSSIRSAQAAIDYHQLGSEVKAYGSPDDLAHDPNVDMIVVSVQVGKHYMLSKPAILAGKDVFVEWPLGASLAEAKELTELSKAKGVKTIVGLQARASPLVVKIKELVQGGKIGKVLSSTVYSSFRGLPTGMWPAGAEYYLDMNSGGNSYTIFFGHFLDSFTHVLGPFSDLHSTLKTEYKSFDIIDMATSAVVETGHPRTSPDHILLQGTLASGAVASVTYYTAPTPAIKPIGLSWTIIGTEGQIEVISPEAAWQIETPGTTLKLRVGNEAAEEVNFDETTGSVVESVATMGKNTARVYEAFLNGDKDGDRVVDFEDAVKTHELLDKIRKEAGW